MKPSSRILIATALFAVLLCPANASAQSPERRFLISGSLGIIFIVDTELGAAAPVQGVDKGAFMALSPDQEHLAVFGEKGLVVYRVSGVTLQEIKRVTSAATNRAQWTPDSGKIIFLLTTAGADGGPTDQIYLWDRATGQTKRLL